METNLVKILTEQTQILKVEFVEKTKKYAKAQYEFHRNRASWGSNDWMREYPSNMTTKMWATIDVETGERIPDTIPASEVFEKMNTGKAERKYVEIPVMGRTAMEQRSKTQNFLRQFPTFEKLEEKEVKYAELHYESSIQKLAARLEKKGVTEDFIIQTSRIGVNIETVITSKDGKITVKAWTIIAEGPIQKPHYRYLVK